MKCKKKARAFSKQSENEGESDQGLVLDKNHFLHLQTENELLDLERA